jgi:hypothetical protein
VLHGPGFRLDLHGGRLPRRGRHRCAGLGR